MTLRYPAEKAILPVDGKVCHVVVGVDFDFHVEARATWRPSGFIGSQRAARVGIEGNDQLRGVLVTAPSELREPLKSKTLRGKSSECALLRPDRTRVHEPLHAAKTALRTLSRRIVFLDEEVDALDAQLKHLAAAAPTLIAQPESAHSIPPSS